MNQQEKQFANSIKNKINKYSIPTTLKEVLQYYSDTLIETQYNNGSTELVDVGVEYRLCQLSALYFIENYAYINLPGTGTIPFSLYYFQKETLKLLPDLNKTVFLKTRQCLTEENYVMTDKGYVSIKGVKPGDKIETIKDGKPFYTLVEDWMDQGEREVCRILTNSGAEVKCTLDHELFTKDGWKEAKDLTLKDEIVSLINKGSFGDFELEDDRHAALIGYYLADGRASQPSFVNTNIDYINEVLEIGKTFENCDAYVYERKDDRDRKQGYDVRLASNTKATNIKRPILDFMERFNLNKKSVDRVFTSELMNLNEKQMSIMLNRLFAGDGYITYNQDKRRPRYIQYEIGIGIPNFDFAKQLEYILQTKYGIHCWISEQFDKRFTQRFWKLRITQKRSVIDFVNRIGIKGKTDTEEIVDLISKENPYKSNQSFEKIRKIERLEEKENVYDITTTTSDFLANGLVVHNCGISTLTSLYCFWLGNFHEGENIDVVSTKQSKAQSFVAKMDATYKNIPLFLKTPIKNKNMQIIKWQNGSEVLSETASENAGRGDSLSLLVLDEAAHYQSDRLTRGIVGAAMPTLSRTGGGLIVISTPNRVSGAGSYYYEQVNSLQIEGNTKESKLIDIDWWEIPDIEGIKPYRGYNEKLNEFIEKDYFWNPLVKEQAKRYFEQVEENWRENPFLNKQYQDLGSILFKQEIFHDFIVGEDQVFGDDVLEDVKSKIAQHKPIYEDKLGSSQLKGLLVWNLPEPKKRYILAADPATGTGKDYAGIQIMDVENYEQVAEYQGKTSTKNLGRIIKILARYYNQAFVVVECNSIGEAVFNEIYYSDNDPYENVYKQKKTRNGITRYTGWETNTKSRQLMTNDLIDWINVDDLRNSMTIKSFRLYQEMTTWVWKSGSKAEHLDGCVSGDTLITLKNGIKQIKDVEEGDLVLTHKGNFKPVYKKYKFKDDKKKMLSVKGTGKMKLNITSNQQNYVYDKNKGEFIFKSFDDIYNFKDYKYTSIFQKLNDESVDYIDLLEYNKNFQHDENFLYWRNKFGDAKIKRNIEVDKNFLFILGHILADGNVSERGTIFITSSNKEEKIKNVYEEFLNKNNINYYYTHLDGKNYFRIVINNIAFWNLVKEIGKSEEKKPLEFMWNLSKKQGYNIFLGYIFGDGSFSESERNRNSRITALTISPNIWNYFCSVLFSNEINFNVSYQNGREVKRKNGKISTEKRKYYINILGKINEIMFNNNPFYDYFLDCKLNYDKIKNTFEESSSSFSQSKNNKFQEGYLVGAYSSVEQVEWDDYFYDISVEEDHSYVANGSVVHNSHDDLLIAFGLCIHLRNKVTEYGDSFFIGDDGTLFQFTEEDKNRKIDDDTFAFETTEKISQDSEDLIREQYGIGMDEYKWLIG